jgi:hypothetical protein
MGWRSPSLHSESQGARGRSGLFPLHDVRHHPGIAPRRTLRPCRATQQVTGCLDLLARAGKRKCANDSGAESTASEAGGARRDRTDDLMLAKHALSQLSYGPNQVNQDRRAVSSDATRRQGRMAARADARNSQGHGRDRRRLRPTTMVGLGRLELPTSRLSSARSNQLSYKPKSRGSRIVSRSRSRIIRYEKEKRRRRCPAKWDLTGPVIQSGSISSTEVERDRIRRPRRTMRNHP